MANTLTATYRITDAGLGLRKMARELQAAMAQFRINVASATGDSTAGPHALRSVA